MLMLIFFWRKVQSKILLIVFKRGLLEDIIRGFRQSAKSTTTIDVVVKGMTLLVNDDRFIYELLPRTAYESAAELFF
jgi:serine kinase of HPr protein (carbohydrate metabolism regulator)